ncbi:class I SAM-dependent methyltransferase [Methylocapsa acidiphila]|uniref:class I SAM-dependent methyltransferase n=1 Tax=Methylocapsa acidiphila TaxID=133552 RepID=UPI000422E4E3|nr:class I SAM-dependent methyltransferase [Methylocapsa acidiphila]
MAFKDFVKRILPAKISKPIGRMRMLYRERRLQRLSLPDAFNEIYKKGMWRQGTSLSGLGSEGLFAERYLRFVQDYIKRHGVETIVDAGCGDFYVGSKLCDNVKKCVALDASSYIIEINAKRYRDIPQVSFHVADLTAAALPSGDLILIRQVLQHLTNEQIERVLTNLEAGAWRYALITEEVSDPQRKPANLDLPTHTIRTRANLGSGVYVDRPPFNRSATRVAVIDDASPGKQASSRLLIFELTKRRAA